MRRQPAITARINGEVRGLPSGMTLDGLLELLKIKRQGIAIDVNREIIPKSLFKETTIKDGDAIEIITMTGGG